MRKKKVKRGLQEKGQTGSKEKGTNGNGMIKRGKKKKGAGAVEWKKRGEKEEKVRKRKQGGMRMGRDAKSENQTLKLLETISWEMVGM